MGKLEQKNGEPTSRDDELLSSEEKLLLQSMALETAANAVLITDANGIILWVNPAFNKLTGYAVEEVIGQTPRLLKSGKHGLEFYKKLWETILAGRTWRGSFTNRRKDGTLYYDEHTITPVRSKEGVITHFIAIMNDVTDRRVVEIALRKSEGRFRLLVDQAADAFFLHDEHGRYLDVNRRACESLGYSREELLKLSVLDVACLSEEEVKGVWNQIQSSSTVTVNDYHRRKDGTRFPVEVRVGSIEIDGQKLFLALVRDITDRKRAEENNVQALALLRATLDSTADGILTIGLDRRILSYNETFVKMWGLTAEILTASSDDLAIRYVVDQLQTPAYFLAKVHHLYEHPLEESFDVLDFKDGRVIERFSRPMLVEGRPIGRVWSFRDVTEQKRAEARIAEQAAFLDKARDAIIVRDLEGRILFWNKGAERVYGWTDAEVLGRNVLEILHTGSKTFEELNGLTISRGEWHGELQHCTKDRGEIITEVRCSLIRDDEGLPKSVLSINTDITEKKKIEAQFMRAQRMESIGTLAGGVAHDLNNILAPIIMSINILKNQSPSPQTTKILESIEASAKRGADIVRQVLSFARGLEIERVAVHPRDLLKDLENMIKDTFPKGIRLQVSILDDTWTILGDSTQVQQILMNLCLNARDAMPNGGTLSIGVENCVVDEQYAATNFQAKAGHYVNISVSDSGTGIPPELLDKIFEPFFTTKELYKGTGLGLSTVMAIVKSHEGTINVYSEPGKGTTFNVYLPAVKIASETRRVQTETGSLPRGNGETILIVDDEASILTITSETLLTFGYRVLTATDGAEAVSIYSRYKNEIAVVLTDMMMPVMDGPATIHALREVNPAVKVVATSGFNSTDEAVNGPSIGVRHFLTKPYSAPMLLKTIRTILNEV